MHRFVLAAPSQPILRSILQVKYNEEAMNFADSSQLVAIKIRNFCRVFHVENKGLAVGELGWIFHPSRRTDRIPGLHKRSFVSPDCLAIRLALGHIHVHRTRRNFLLHA